MDCDAGSTNERSHKIPIEHKTVATGFKEDSDEKEVKAMIEWAVIAVEMKGGMRGWLSRYTTHACFRGIPK